MSTTHSRDGGDDAEQEEYFTPTGGAEPLTNRTVLPKVKRINRKTVAALAGLVGLAVVLAISTVIRHKPVANKQPDPASQTAAALGTTPEVINTLRGYSDSGGVVPRLGPKLPGDVGAAAMPLRGNGIGALSPNNGQVRQLTPYEQALYQAQVDALKRAERAREGGFGFSGGSAGAISTPAGELPFGSDGGSVADRLRASLTPGDDATASRDNDNRQDDKAAFAEKNRQKAWDLQQGMQTPSSPYTIMAGTVLPGVIITGINSDLPGPIEGQVSQSVYDTVTGQHLLIPQGSRVLGTYDSRVTYGQSLILVVWTRIIRPDGTNLDLEGMPGVDLSGYSGLTGKIDRHLKRLLTAVVLGSVIEAGASNGINYGNPNYADTARLGASRGVNEATQQIVRKELNIQPTILVKPGARFNVFTTKDIVMPPYRG